MYFWDDLGRHGDRVAFVDERGDTLRYAELATAGTLFAGIESPALLLLEIDNSLAAMTAYVAALQQKLPAILVNAGDDRAIERLIAAFAPDARWSAGGGLQRLAGAPDAALHPDLALMLSTSGTTGATKLVRLSARAVDANARSIVEYLEIDGEERAITTLPPGYSYGLSVVNSHLAAGATVILNNGSVIDAAFRTLVDEQRATSMAGVPYTYELLDRAGFLDDLPPSIRTLTQAGGKLGPDAVRAIGQLASAARARFFVMYGQTEATARMAYLPPALLADHPDCIGDAIPGGHFDLVDLDSGQAGQDEGELVYSGPNVMMGYAYARADLARGQELAQLHTGDIARRVAPNLLRITGRKSRFLKLFGLRIGLDEVEQEAARQGITLVATGTDDQLVLASTDETALRAMRASLAHQYGLPESSIAATALAEIPRLASGKIDYQAIIAVAAEQAAAADAVQTPAAERLRAFFQSLSPREPITGAASFTSLHGDSLSYVQATVLIEAALGTLPPSWETMTLDELEAKFSGGAVKARRGFRAVEGEMLARCLAITAITANHAWYTQQLLGTGIAGGAGLLIAIFGYNLFRFRGTTLLSARPLMVVPPIFLRYILPYFLVMAVFMAKDGFDWHNVALIGVFYDGPSGSLHLYWFFETLFHLTLILGLLFSIRPIRSAMRASPQWTALALMVGATLVRIGVEWVRPAFDIPPRTPDAFLFLALGGIALAVARNWQTRLAVIAFLVVATLYHGAELPRLVLLGLGLSILIFLPRVRLPTPLAILVREVAGSTIYIYLASRFVMVLFENKLQNRYPFTHFVATFLVGIALGHLVRFIGTTWKKRRASAAFSTVQHHTTG